jgi:hypothetical protein
MRRVVFAAVLAALLAPLPAAAGSIITLSSASSDETPAADLDATFDFSVVGSTLTLVVTNDTTDPDEFNINEIYFNASDTSSVTGLTFTSAMHSVEGNVMMDWSSGMPRERQIPPSSGLRSLSPSPSRSAGRVPLRRATSSRRAAWDTRRPRSS